MQPFVFNSVLIFMIVFNYPTIAPSYSVAKALEKEMGGTSWSWNCIYGKRTNCGELGWYGDNKGSGWDGILHSFQLYSLNCLYVQLTSTTVVDREDLDGNPNGFAIHVRIFRLLVVALLKRFLFCSVCSFWADKRRTHAHVVLTGGVITGEEELAYEVGTCYGNRQMGKFPSVVFWTA